MPDDEIQRYRELKLADRYTGEAYGLQVVADPTLPDGMFEVHDTIDDALAARARRQEEAS